MVSLDGDTPHVKKSGSTMVRRDMDTTTADPLIDTRDTSCQGSVTTESLYCWII